MRLFKGNKGVGEIVEVCRIRYHIERREEDRWIGSGYFMFTTATNSSTHQHSRLTDKQAHKQETNKHRGLSDSLFNSISRFLSRIEHFCLSFSLFLSLCLSDLPLTTPSVNLAWPPLTQRLFQKIFNFWRRARLCNAVYGCFAAFSLGSPRANSGLSWSGLGFPAWLAAPSVFFISILSHVMFPVCASLGGCLF